MLSGKFDPFSVQITRKHVQDIETLCAEAPSHMHFDRILNATLDERLAAHVM